MFFCFFFKLLTSVCKTGNDELYNVVPARQCLKEKMADQDWNISEEVSILLVCYNAADSKTTLQITLIYSKVADNEMT